MPRWPSVELRARAKPPLLWLGVSLASVSQATDGVTHAAPAGAHFVVEHAVLRLAGGHYVADARIDFAFSEDTLEAMRNGVPVTVVVDLEVRRERRYWWDETLVARRLRHRIETNLLTGRYRVLSLNGRRARTYRSLEEMVASLGRLESVPVIARARLSPDERYTARVRARLDIEALPSPMRPVAYLSRHWRLDSDWFEWRVEP